MREKEDECWGKLNSSLKLNILFMLHKRIQIRKYEELQGIYLHYYSNLIRNRSSTTQANISTLSLKLECTYYILPCYKYIGFKHLEEI